MSDFCECGVTLERGEEQCRTCAGAPHHRECPCDECEAYWSEVARTSAVAAAAFNRRLVCTCGWTGPYIEQHERQLGCEISVRQTL